jgi:hypothetical protein
MSNQNLLQQAGMDLIDQLELVMAEETDREIQEGLPLKVATMLPEHREEVGMIFP